MIHPLRSHFHIEGTIPFGGHNIFSDNNGCDLPTRIDSSVLSGAMLFKMNIKWKIVALITERHSGSDEQCLDVCDVDPIKFGIAI